MINNLFWKNKRVLITGDTGFKGSWLTKILAQNNAVVLGYSLEAPKNSHFTLLNLEQEVSSVYGDIRDKERLSNAISEFAPEIVFHLAAQPLVRLSYQDPVATMETNIMGSVNLLDAVRNTESIRSLVFVTSDKCYESNYSTKGFKENDKLGGKDPYSGSKASAEIIINSYWESFFKNKKCGLASGRAGNVIGGGDWSENRLIPDAINSIIKNKTIHIRNPNFNRPWQHVLEPLYGYLILGEKLYNKPKIYSGPWNFGTKKNTVTNVLKIVNEIVKFWGKGKIKFKKNKKFYEQTNLQLNIDKSMKILKWQPKYTITKSVQVTTDWYKKILIEKLSVEKITEKQIKDYMNEAK